MTPPQDAPPKPPARLRYLAALAHGSFWALITLFLLLSAFFPRLNLPVPVVLAGWILGVLGPVALALLLSRRGAWGGFLFRHGARAAAAHGTVGVAYLAGSAVEMGTTPEFIGQLIGSASGTIFVVWAILTMGAAFRAKEGGEAWYPFISRLIRAER